MDILEAKNELNFKKNLLSMYEQALDPGIEGILISRKRYFDRQDVYLEIKSREGSEIVKRRYLISEEMREKASLVYLNNFYKKSIPLLKADIAALAAFINNYRAFSIHKVTSTMGNGYRDYALNFPVNKELNQQLLQERRVLDKGWDFFSVANGNGMDDFEGEVNFSMRWSDLEERQNDYHSESLIHTGPRGNYRSKSEVFIALQLHGHGIDFKYEPALHLKNRTVYPDFAILNPKTGRVVFWEHGGLMDKDDYAENLGVKLKEYSEENINLGDNLILTVESERRPLSFSSVENIIKVYFEK